MADKKNETTEDVEATEVEETPVAAEPQATDDSETTPAAEEPVAVEETPEPGAAAEPEAAEPAAEEAAEPEAEEVAEPAAEPEAAAEPEEAPEPEAAAGEAAEAGSAAPAKRARSQRHVPRSLRRTRSKTAREKPATRKAIVRLPKPESGPGRRQERRGVVVSDKGDKTIIVKVDVMKTHPRYKKVVRRSVKFHAHDEGNTAGVGDTVRIVETRPLSKTKRWRLAEIVEKAR
jgi:small subunit ribosomal protein S17